MKLNSALALLLALSTSILIVSGVNANYRVKNLSPPPLQVHGLCRQFFENQSDNCGTSLCPATDFQYNDGTSSGPGIQSLQNRTVTCRQEVSGNCENSISQVHVAAPDTLSCCDQDGDLYNRTACGGSDCNDDDPNLTPADNDGDGYSTCQGDCNDNPNNGGVSVNPGAIEFCDGIDNNCANGIDEGYDQDHDGYTTCQGDCDDTKGHIHPYAELGHCIGMYMQFRDWNCNWEDDYYELECPSPIVIDVEGNGFNLTDGSGGVAFDLDSDGTAEHLSWTASRSDDAWLALDRDGNGKIDNGQELFGNFTPQPTPSPQAGKNGFLALAEFDKQGLGGNGDGRINQQDSIFENLRLWQDKNHNGISETTELHTLKQLGLETIELSYKDSRRRDQHGNWFRFRAKVNGKGSSPTGKWAYDVFLIPR